MTDEDIIKAVRRSLKRYLYGIITAYVSAVLLAVLAVVVAHNQDLNSQRLNNQLFCPVYGFLDAAGKHLPPTATQQQIAFYGAIHDAYVKLGCTPPA